MSTKKTAYDRVHLVTASPYSIRIDNGYMRLSWGTKDGEDFALFNVSDKKAKKHGMYKQDESENVIPLFGIAITEETADAFGDFFTSIAKMIRQKKAEA